MSEHELIEAYKAGRIGQVKFFRALVVGGMSVGAALSLALAAAPGARADDVCLPGSCPTAPAVAAINNAALNISNVAQNANASSNGIDNVALNTGNAADHLRNVAGNLPGNTR